MPPRPEASLDTVSPVLRVDRRGAVASEDRLALEEPLEIRLAYGPVGDRQEHTVAVTMRTPGHDAELAVGFLLGEGLLRTPGDLAGARGCGPVSEHGAQNVVRVDLAPGASVDPARLDRRFYTTSSCGLCGKGSIEALRVEAAPLASAGFTVGTDAISRAPERLREAQTAFDRTGGLHAAGLFDAAGALVLAREDVGRHNAVDKVVGALALEGRLPAAGHMLVVSGRASFELVQKALVAGMPMLAAVGAPSSLAAELAREYGLTLAGFVRDGRFNLYSGEWRVRAEEGR